MWWIAIGLICGLIVVYIALRIYINTILFREAKFKLVLQKLQREVEAIVTEFNRITDRNVTVAEETAIKLNKLIKESHKYLTRLSKVQPSPPPSSSSPPPSPPPPTPTPLVPLYSPRLVADRSAAAPRADADPASEPTTHEQIVHLIHNDTPHEQIAARVGVSVSEVETVAAMLNK